jgi:hypothetical protein
MRIKAGSVKPRFDLTGKDGNAFNVLGIAGNLCRQIGIDSEPILKEMMSGNYENLLNVFEKHFGDYVEIVVADDKDE